MSKRLYELRPVTEEKGLKDGMISVGCGCVVSLQERNGGDGTELDQDTTKRADQRKEKKLWRMSEGFIWGHG